MLLSFCTGNMHSTVTGWNLHCSAFCARSRKKLVRVLRLILALTAGVPFILFRCAAVSSVVVTLWHYVDSVSSEANKTINRLIGWLAHTHTVQRHLTTVVTNLQYYLQSRVKNIIKLILCKNQWGIKIDTSDNWWANRHIIATGHLFCLVTVYHKGKHI